MSKIQLLMQRVVLGFIFLYRYGLRPFLAGGCRHFPSCSTYMEEAIKRHGVYRGFFCGIKRLMRCHSWSQTPVFDPVPKQLDKFLYCLHLKNEPKK